jgi:predicted nucleic acid-binding protein
MKHLVVDCSITMGWCFEDEKSPAGDGVLDLLEKEETQALVPDLWHLEVTNVLTMAIRKKRLSMAKALLFLDLLENLPIIIADKSDNMKDLLILANTYELTSYGAAYLDLALREQVPLVTSDIKLLKAAKAAGVEVI